MTEKTIAIIDYGMGNLHSVASALAKVAPDHNILITSTLSEIRDAGRIVFPGVGAIRDCVAEIKRLSFDQAVSQAINAGKPVLGICVGMQSLLSASEENKGVECLNVVPGKVRFFSNNEAFLRSNDESSASGERLKVPHMGWNQVAQTRPHALWEGIPNNSRFYFVHSYYAELEDKAWETGSSHYGINFSAALGKGNLFAVQFHPEKSHLHGLQLLKNFVYWDGKS